MGVANGNVGLAFGLVIAAGLSTTIGSAFVFCSSYANTKLLAAALGVSAGVMIYVSFVEILEGRQRRADGQCRRLPCQPPRCHGRDEDL